jgi:E3 ubiquitin-protein ligase HUWE1
MDQSAELSTASLGKFTPASSSQAQLLRLLKTIDYLHSEKVDSDPPGEVLTEQEKAIAQTFDSLDFDSMWKQLSECLSTVDARGSTDQISTVLLPLVEALMVICKYRRPENTRETRSPSVPPSSTDETDSLFVTFTTTHRKVLNAIVRNTPSLLSGSFSLLVRNPRVLEFDNKRNWFLQKLRRKRDMPASVPHLPLNIRRQYVFEDSFRALERRSGQEVKYGKLSVKFYNEDGIDAGGVTREWYSVLAQQIFDPNFGKCRTPG